jgi:hypothetical protein
LEQEREHTRLSHTEARLLREALLWSTSYGVDGDDVEPHPTARMGYDQDLLFAIVDALDAATDDWYGPGRESDPHAFQFVERAASVMGEGKRSLARDLVLTALRITDDTTSKADRAVAIEASREDLRALTQKLDDDSTTAAISAGWARVEWECCPDVYYCPASDDIECVRHGGFSVCCSRPQDHLSVGVNAGMQWARDTAWDVTHRSRLQERVRGLVIELVRDRGSVDVSSYGKDLEVISVTPRNPGARAIWICFEDSLIVEVGEVGGRWELGYSEGSVDFLQELLESVIAGRVEEVFAPARSMVIVTLDGGIVRETGHDGPKALFPLPFWRRWGRRVRYMPYGT